MSGNEGKKGAISQRNLYTTSLPPVKNLTTSKVYLYTAATFATPMLPRMPLPAQEENRRSGPISHAKAPQGIGVPKGAIRLQNKGLNTRKRDLAREGLNAFGQKRGPFALFRLILPFHLISPFCLISSLYRSLNQSNVCLAVI